jgi:transcriptional regulator with XRE-family HTH domain
MEDFAARLVAAMTEKGVKNPEVAEAVGVVPNTVSKWRQRLQKPSDDQLPKLAAYLGKSEAWLRYGDRPAGPNLVGGFSETGPPRHARNLPLAVREYLAEFQLRLTKGGASEDEIDEAMALLRSPDVFVYFKGGRIAEYNEADVLDGMRSLAEDVIIPRLQKLGRKLK